MSRRHVHTHDLTRNRSTYWLGPKPRQEPVLGIKGMAWAAAILAVAWLAGEVFFKVLGSFIIAFGG